MYIHIYIYIILILILTLITDNVYSHNDKEYRGAGAM